MPANVMHGSGRRRGIDAFKTLHADCDLDIERWASAKTARRSINRHSVLKNRHMCWAISIVMASLKKRKVVVRRTVVCIESMTLSIIV